MVTRVSPRGLFVELSSVSYPHSLCDVEAWSLNTDYHRSMDNWVFLWRQTAALLVLHLV